MKKRNPNSLIPGNLIAIGFLFIWVILLFAYTVWVRQPWFGRMQTFNHHLITGSTLMFVKSWLEDGIFRDHFTLFQEVKSALNAQADYLRHPYVTYPIGTFLPLFLLAKLKLVAWNPATVMGWNLANQLAVSLTLTATAFLALRKWGAKHIESILWCLPIPVIMLFLPGPMYWHQNTFFADQAIIFLFSLFLFSEVLGWYATTEKQRKILSVAQKILLFWGTFTDWLFVFITIVYAAIHLAQGKLGKKFWLIVKNTLALVWPSILACFLYLVNALLGASILYIAEYVLFRTALDSRGQGYIQGRLLNLWTNWLPLAYGRVGQILIITLVAALGISLILAWRRVRAKQALTAQAKQLLTLLTLTLGSCVFQVTVFENHSVIHNFSSLKFSVTLGLFPFVLLPYFFFKKWLAQRTQTSTRTMSILIIFVPLVFLGLAGWYASHEFPRYKAMFKQNEDGPRILGEAVHRNATKEDVLLSSSLLIDLTTPYPMFYADTTMAKVFNWTDVKAVLAHSQVKDRIIFVLASKDLWEKELEVVRPCAYEVRHDSGYVFYYFRGNNFSPMCTKAQ